MCEKSTLNKINKQCNQTIQSPIHFVSSGNYHYLSFLFLKKYTSNFTLVLFDHHSDAKKSPSSALISCGSWVKEALVRLPQLKKVLFIGIGESQIPTLKDLPLGSYFYVTENQLTDPMIKLKLLRAVSTDSIYFSVDKDVFNKQEASTNWDQGKMNWQLFKEYSDYLLKGHTLLGVDICGEPKKSISITSSSDYRKSNRLNYQLAAYFSVYFF